MASALRSAADLWKFRARMALALRDHAPDAVATPAELDHLVEQQIAYWRRHPPLAGAAAGSALRDLNERSISAFVLALRGQRVGLWPKPEPSLPGQEPAERREQRQAFLRRAALYRAFLERTLRRARLDCTFDVALDVNDFPADSPELPVIGFQKPHGGHNLLLPDVDFFHQRWYRREQDALSYEQKSNTACFVGSSTGGWLTVDTIRRHETPRLRAAAHFHGNPRVLFRLANAVQCRSDEARAYLESQPYFSRPLSWDEQLRHRFLISMDGNGAACSRLVKGLFSNSVVVKYASPHELYYFPALTPGTHYLSVSQDDDIERVLDTEAAHPGSFKPVSEAGQRFARRYLSIRSVMDYTAGLLKAVAGLIRP